MSKMRDDNCGSDIRTFFKPKQHGEEEKTDPDKTKPVIVQIKRSRSETGVKSPDKKRFKNDENESEIEQKSLSKEVKIPLRERSSSLSYLEKKDETDESRRSSFCVDKQVSVVLPVDKGIAKLSIYLADLKKQKEIEKEEEEVYEVDKIVDYSWCRVTLKGMYKVRWEGWAEEHDTWEVFEHLEECAEKLKEFYIERLKQRENATPSQKRFLEVPPDPKSQHERNSEFAHNVCPAPCMSVAEQFMRDLKKKPIKAWHWNHLKSQLEKFSKRKKLSESKLEELRNQLMIKHVQRLRDDQLRRLAEWEGEVNSLSTENAKISVQNDFDLEGPPRYMTYINTYKPSAGIIIPDDPPIGCECESCDVKSERLCCPGFHGHPIAYNRYGRLRINVGVPIYECNKKCKCGIECHNRVIQNGRRTKLCIYRTENGCGWGVKTLENIKQGAFVVEYVGEVITTEEAEERGKKYDAEGRTYLFDLDYNLGDANPYTVDAAFYGNVSHFINHSCDPNLEIFNAWIDCLDPNLPRLCMFAARDIVKGEQITFDYRQRAGLNESIPEQSNNEDESQNKMECRCGTANCRKILFC